MADTVESLERLRMLYGQPSERARLKELKTLDKHCRHFISLSPFVVVASAGANGRLDCSPRGDAPGFVRVLDNHTVLLPDRRGNNRVDTLSNIVEHPQVGLLFFIPGVEETLRLNGRAEVVLDDDLLAPSTVNDRAPRSGLKIAIEEVFLQCSKALVRSRLWDAEAQIERRSFPSLGQILADQIANTEDPEEIDRQLEVNKKESLY
ncbi:MAG: pyridoxamine 5'-phosphate oxidase family protein [Pseudomonadota bacterium]